MTAFSPRRPCAVDGCRLPARRARTLCLGHWAALPAGYQARLTRALVRLTAPGLSGPDHRAARTAFVVARRAALDVLERPHGEAEGAA